LVVGLDERGLVRNIDGVSENVDSTKEMNLSMMLFYFLHHQHAEIYNKFK
jgi:hypothetical protein